MEKSFEKAVLKFRKGDNEIQEKGFVSIEKPKDKPDG